jgi:hypothetical protein
MILLTLAKYVVVFGMALLGLRSALHTLRKGIALWRSEEHHRFDLRSFFMSDPNAWHHWPASHWLTAGTVVLAVSAGLMVMGLLG